MFKNRFFLISALSLSAMAVKAADSMKKIDAINDSDREMQIVAQDADSNFKVAFKVPTYAKAVVVAKVISFQSLQSQLLAGIRNNSVREIEQAIADGANVNAKIEGQTPMAWAMALCKADAIVCLINHQAR